MSRINRVLIMFGVLLMLSGTAMAFEEFPASVRTGVLGAGDDVASSYWKGSDGVTTWYGDLVTYADMATISFHEGSSAKAFSFNKSEETFGNYYIAIQQTQIYKTDDMNHFTLGYGYALENMDLGFMFNRQSASTTNADGDETSEVYHLFGIGVDYDLNEDTEIDASFGFMKGSMTDETLPDGADEPFDPSGFAFNVRAFHNYRDDLVLVPVFGFQSVEMMEDVTEKEISLGLGFAYTINESNDFVFGLSYQSCKEEDDTGTETVEDNTTVMPGISLAVEHEFTDWLTVRAGATKNWTKYSDEGDAVNMDYPFEFQLGAGLAFGDWTIDLALNESWMYNSGYWFHGNQGSEAPIAKIQAKLFF